MACVTRPTSRDFNIGGGYTVRVSWAARNVVELNNSGSKQQATRPQQMSSMGKRVMNGDKAKVTRPLAGIHWRSEPFPKPKLSGDLAC